MIEKKISIIIPVYNCEKYLDRTLSSVINQTYKNLEIILVNDCSQDNSLSICQNYAEKDERIKLINLSQNEGASNARNIGIKEARGEYIQFVDSDDYLELNACERLLEGIDNSDLVICGFKESGIIETKFSNKEEKKYNLKEDYCTFFELVKNRQIHNVWNKLYLKSKITSGFDKKITIGEDVLFNLNYLKNCKDVFVIKDVLYNYDYTNLNSIMHTKNRETQELLDYWDEIYKFCEGYFVDKGYIKSLNGTFIKAIMAQIMNLSLKEKKGYKNYRKIFLSLRKLPQVKEAFKNYSQNVFINKSWLQVKLLFVTFKLKLTLPFYIFTKYRNKRLEGK